MTNSIVRWDSSRAGCIFNGSSTRTADELNADVVLLALGEGWVDDDAKELARKFYDLPTNVRWFDDQEDSETMSFFSDEAVDWLNEFIAPEGFWFEFDDGFYLNEETE